jgi:hypothetical protein
MNTKEEVLKVVNAVLNEAQATDEVKMKVLATFNISTANFSACTSDYIRYLVKQLITLYSYKFPDDDRMSIPVNMVHLMAGEKMALPTILLHWRVYLALYKPYVKGWRLETLKDAEGKPVGMVAVITDKDGTEWRWERYYENHAKAAIPVSNGQPTGKDAYRDASPRGWKNRELMFAKTILKEALAVMYPELNLLPPLSTVETYDPDDLDEAQQAVRQVPAQAEQKDQKPVKFVAMYSGTTPIAVKEEDKAEKPERSKEAGLAREMQEVYKELVDLIGEKEALGFIKDRIAELGGEKFSDLSAPKKGFLLTILRSEIDTRKAIGGGKEG